MDYVLHVVIFICIYAILAVGYNILIGYSGLFSFAQAAFYGIGAYTCALLAIHWGLNFFIAMLVGCLAAMLVGVVIAIPALRVTSHYLVIFTLGFQIVAYEVMTNLVDITGGEGGLRGIPSPNLFGIHFLSRTSYMILAIVLAIICVAIMLRVVNSPFGRVLKAMRDDEVALQAQGKNIIQLKVLAFVLASMMAAIAGALYAHYVRFINPFTFSLSETILILTLIIVGGTGNMWGSVLGAAVLIALPEAFAFLKLPAYVIGPGREIFYGVLLIVMVVFRPQGILPEFRGTKAKPTVATPSLQENQPNKQQASPVIKPEMLDKEGELALEVKNLYKAFGGLQAVNNFSMSLEKGKITCLVGPNGAGKTTAFNLVTGFIPVDRGGVYRHGKNITNLPAYKGVSLGLARTFQDVRLFYQMTVLDNVLVARQKQSGENLLQLFFNPLKVNREERENRERAMFYLDKVGLTSRAYDLAEDLSFPEQKLLSLARLLATEADILLLDEPCSSLDPSSMDKLLDFIKKLPGQGKSICVVEHNLDVVKRLADKVYFLDRGKVIAIGSAEEVMADPRLAEIYFGG